jgi:hypothetical protein
MCFAGQQCSVYNIFIEIPFYDGHIVVNRMCTILIGYFRLKYYPKTIKELYKMSAYIIIERVHRHVRDGICSACFMRKMCSVLHVNM